MIVTDERLEHIKHHHPQDLELFEEHVCDCITMPDLIITDSKNAGTVFMIKKLADTNLTVVLRLVLAHEERKLQNSIMTFWRIRNRNLKKLMNKGEVLYKRE